MDSLGEILDPVRKQIIEVKDALAHARYRYDGIDLILEGVSDARARAAAQEIFSTAAEKMDMVDAMLDALYRDVADLDRKLENLPRNR